MSLFSNRKILNSFDGTIVVWNIFLISFKNLKYLFSLAHIFSEKLGFIHSYKLYMKSLNVILKNRYS